MPMSRYRKPSGEEVVVAGINAEITINGEKCKRVDSIKKFAGVSLSPQGGTPGPQTEPKSSPIKEESAKEAAHPVASKVVVNK